MIKTELMEHQKNILDFILHKEYFGVFADYGTGKTLCVLAYIDYLKIKKVLVTSSKLSILTTWITEIKKHTDKSFVLLVGTKKEKHTQMFIGLRKCQMNNDTVYFLVNYDGVKNIFNDLVKCNFDMMIVDESTKIKNPYTERTKALISLGSYFRKRCVMTGFPVTENMKDLYSQIKFLDGGKVLGNNYHVFLDTYFYRIKNLIIAKKDSGTKIIDNIKSFCIRVSNSSIKLPPIDNHIIEIPLTKQQDKLINQLNEEFRIEFDNGVKINTDYIFSLISKGVQICNGFVNDTSTGKIEIIDTLKDEILLDTLEEVNPFKNKVVIWCPFKFIINKLSILFEKVGYKYVVLSGDTKDDNLVVDKFRYSDINILLTTQKKSSDSVTLVEANYGFYYSNTWSNDEKNNSLARIRRKGSEIHDKIYYKEFITKGNKYKTIEEMIFLSLTKKSDLVQDLKSLFTEVQC